MNIHGKILIPIGHIKNHKKGIILNNIEVLEIEILKDKIIYLNYNSNIYDNTSFSELYALLQKQFKLDKRKDS